MHGYRIYAATANNYLSTRQVNKIVENQQMPEYPFRPRNASKTRKTADRILTGNRPYSPVHNHWTYTLTTLEQTLWPPVPATHTLRGKLPVPNEAGIVTLT